MNQDCIEIIQGDQYPLPFRITHRGQPLSPDTISTLEITIGTLNKSLLSDAYDQESQMWSFPLTHAETLTMPVGLAAVELCVTFPGGDIVNAQAPSVYIVESKAKEVRQNANS